MVDQNTLEAIKTYIKKLRRIVMQEAEFEIFGCKLIKRTRIDDVLCCFIAILPKAYKRALDDINCKLNSRLAYNRLYAGLKKKFILNSNLYAVDQNEILESINIFLQTFEKDIDWAEKNDY